MKLSMIVRNSRTTPDDPVELARRLVGPVVEDPHHVQEHEEHHQVGGPPVDVPREQAEHDGALDVEDVRVRLGLRRDVEEHQVHAGDRQHEEQEEATGRRGRTCRRTSPRAGGPAPGAGAGTRCSSPRTPATARRWDTGCGTATARPGSAGWTGRPAPGSSPTLLLPRRPSRRAARHGRTPCRAGRRSRSPGARTAPW